MADVGNKWTFHSRFRTVSPVSIVRCRRRHPGEEKVGIPIGLW